MTRHHAPLVLAACIAGCAPAATGTGAPEASAVITDQAVAAPADALITKRQELPAGAADALARLQSSPRHGEWAMVRDGRDSIRVWVVYPERSGPAPVVLVVHEIYGLTHWIRAVADQLAADGFIAIAPDLLTMQRLPTDARGEPVRDSATAAIRTLEPARYHRQLVAVADWGMALPAAANRYGIVGFCWGGAAAFQHAISSATVNAAVVYYGSSPATAALAGVRAPVLGLYAGDDERVNATIAPADAALRQLGRPFDYHVFAGAGHGFLRQQEGREGANLNATARAWPLTLQFFRQHLER